jgi:hypothetical protein
MQEEEVSAQKGIGVTTASSHSGYKLMICHHNRVYSWERGTMTSMTDMGRKAEIICAIGSMRHHARTSWGDRISR